MEHREQMEFCREQIARMRNRKHYLAGTHGLDTVLGGIGGSCIIHVGGHQYLRRLLMINIAKSITVQGGRALYSIGTMSRADLSLVGPFGGNLSCMIGNRMFVGHSIGLSRTKPVVGFVDDIAQDGLYCHDNLRSTKRSSQRLGIPIFVGSDLIDNDLPPKGCALDELNTLDDRINWVADAKLTVHLVSPSTVKVTSSRGPSGHSAGSVCLKISPCGRFLSDD